MILFLLLIVVNGEGIFCGDECSYSIVDETILTIEVNGGITKNNWENENGVIQMIVRGKVDYVPSNFIRQFEQLEEAEIDVESIPNGLFSQSNVKKVTIESTVKLIEERAFENCLQLESIIFKSESSLKTIESFAFRNCHSLKSIVLPKSIQTIDFNKVFEGCSNLETIEIEYGNELYASENNIIYSTDKKTILYQQKSKETFGIDNDVVRIGEKVYAESEMKSVPFSDKIEEIGDTSFYFNKELKSLLIPSNINKIEQYAFAMSEQLESVVILSNEIVIGEGAFAGCSQLKSVYFFGNQIELGEDVFEGSGTQEIKVNANTFDGHN